MSDFKIHSGLGVNNDKTKLMPLNISSIDDPVLTNLGFKIVSEIKVTGVTFTYNMIKTFPGKIILPLHLRKWKQCLLYGSREIFQLSE